MDQRLPELNRRVLRHFVAFLRHFTDEKGTAGETTTTTASAGAANTSASSTHARTRPTHMPLDVLCLVMAPLILRPPRGDESSNGVTQRLQKETNFMKTLILHLVVDQDVEEEKAPGVDMCLRTGDVVFDV